MQAEGFQRLLLMTFLLCSQLMQLRILPDDIIVSGTDGLFDNVFAEEVASLVTFARKRGDSPALAATVLASYTQMKAAETTHMSPFAYAAQVKDLSTTPARRQRLDIQAKCWMLLLTLRRLALRGGTLLAQTDWVSGV